MIKNYTSKTNNTHQKIQQILAKHGVTKMMFEYGKDGKVYALSFAMMIDGQEVPFKLPANVDKVHQIFLNEGYKDDEKTRNQAYRTAWANIRDWVDAQLALVETEQVELEQVFLPYVVQRDGRTYFEHAKENQFLLGSGGQDGK